MTKYTPEDSNDSPISREKRQVCEPQFSNSFQIGEKTSNNSIELRNYKVTKLNGKNTGQTGVAKVTTSAHEIQCTNIERTLIDASVRPIYCGGIFEVAKAFEKAAPNISIPSLIKTLRKMDFAYPYHQVIGYYLDRTGFFNPSDLDPIIQLGIDFDFYLDYKIRNREFNEKWRLFIPKRF